MTDLQVTTSGSIGTPAEHIRLMYQAAVLLWSRAHIACGFAIMSRADRVAVYEDYGISPGMQKGIDEAKRLGIPLEMRRIEP